MPKGHQLALAALQSTFDFPQGVGPAKLAEQHADNLAPTRHALAAIVGSRLLDDALEIGARGMSLSIWLNMLHEAFTLGLLRLEAGGFGDLPTPYTFG
jgi:hypothetical protein